MSNDVFTFDRGAIRASDSNSLLRLYDLAMGIINKSKLQQQRARADKALHLIARELKKRNVTM
jgi:hypothetical protein